ncbi:hypothetical protein GP486_004138 [Trichoglossum hirsutum]|uniref:Uncharacterized protein n=1 Tax=Trichoglossum hirsutum TaxID=265104 RepID=A0A9P8RQ70_9PEZI|nr:hypothetical protein GP486_004138 [Trichoglossum hirsutum]
MPIDSQPALGRSLTMVVEIEPDIIQAQRNMEAELVVDTEPAHGSDGTPSKAELASSDSAPEKRDQGLGPDSPQHLADSTTPVRGSVLQSKSKQLRLSWVSALGTLLLSVFATFYAWSVLVSVDPALAPLQSLSPGKTVWVVNILSQATAFSILELLNVVFEALRWTLASGISGVQITTFLALSRATPLLGVVSLCLVKGAHRLWCIQRLLVLGLTWLLGVVLTYNINFKHVYTSNQNYNVNVIAGLAHPNSSLIAWIPSTMINIHFLAFTHSILFDSTFVTGGLRQVRLQNQEFNSSLFNGQLPEDSQSVLIHNAPGYQLDFSLVEGNYTFDSGADCTTYGQTTGLGLHLCIASDGPRILAGWSVCPSSLFDRGRCFDDTGWATIPEQNTSLSLFKRYATVAYDRNNFSILSVESISDPSLVPLVVQDYRNIYERVFAPVPKDLNTLALGFNDSATTYTMQAGIGWTLRLYQDYFHRSSVGPIRLLQGLLTVPIQFSTTAWQIADIDSLPQDLHTVASMTKTTYRVTGVPWTVFVFGGLALFLLLLAISGLAWINLTSVQTPNTSLFPEVDICSKCGNPAFRSGTTEGVRDLTQFLQNKCLGNAESKSVKLCLGDERIYCGALHGCIVVTTKPEELGELVEGTEYR